MAKRAYHFMVPTAGRLLHAVVVSSEGWVMAHRRLMAYGPIWGDGFAMIESAKGYELSPTTGLQFSDRQRPSMWSTEPVGARQ